MMTVDNDGYDYVIYRITTREIFYEYENQRLSLAVVTLRFREAAVYSEAEALEFIRVRLLNPHENQNQDFFDIVATPFE